MNNPKIFLGTAGWSYKDWVPHFYPKNQSKNFDWLQFYAQYFNCVEVNSTYYTYLNPDSVRNWLDKIDDEKEFQFTLKLHQDFTHKKDFNEDKIKAVKTNFDILQKGERLGGVLLQFPYSFSFDENSAEHLNNLNEIFQNYNRFVEVRHKSWNSEQALELLKNLDVTYCTIDQPQIGKAIPFEPIITNDKAYFRFHGRNVEAWRKSLANFGKEQTYEEASERYKYLYSPAELFEFEEKIKEIYEKVKKVYVIMNNHPSTHGVVNAFELLFTLGGRKKIDIPENTVKYSERLKDISKNSAEQGSLFS